MKDLFRIFRRFKVFPLLLALLYSFYGISALLPLADYLINFNYIVEELCVQREAPENLCMGSCHAAKLLKTMEAGDSDKKSAEEINLKLPSAHCIETTEDEHRALSRNEYDTSYSINFLSVISSPQIPPPKSYLA